MPNHQSIGATENESNADSCKSSTSLETALCEAVPANSADGAYWHLVAYETLSVVCHALSR